MPATCSRLQRTSGLIRARAVDEGVPRESEPREAPSHSRAPAIPPKRTNGRRREHQEHVRFAQGDPVSWRSRVRRGIRPQNRRRTAAGVVRQREVGDGYGHGRRAARKRVANVPPGPGRAESRDGA